MKKKWSKFLGAVLAVVFLYFLVPGIGPSKGALPTDVLIKGSDPTVYYYANDGKRYVFPNAGTYHSWFSDFSGVMSVSDEELAQISIGGNVTYRPGVRLAKIASDARVYAVAPGGVLRWITSESLAERLYGSRWNRQVDDLPPPFFADYELGEPIGCTSDYDPLMIAGLIQTINTDKSLPLGQGPRWSDTTVDIGDAARVSVPSDEPLSNQEIFARVAPAIVQIIVETEDGTVTGSGMILEENGYVLTNAHVVFDATSLLVKVRSDRSYEASIVSRDELVDIALLKIDGDVCDLPTVEFERQKVADVGEEVVTLGYPFGLLGDPSFKEGTVSRRLVGSDGVKYVETSAEIHPGNSGGAMVNRYGRVIGIPTFVIGQGIGGIIFGEAIKFAIDSETVVALLSPLKFGRDVIFPDEDTASEEEMGDETEPEDRAVTECTSDIWECGDWGSCSLEGVQRRTCTLAFDCVNVDIMRPLEVHSCNPSSGTPSFPRVSVPTDDREAGAGMVIEGEDAILSKYRFEGGKEELKLTRVRLHVAEPNNIDALRLYDGETMIGKQADVSAFGYADFSGLDVSLPAYGVKTFTVKGGISAFVGEAESGADVKVTMKDMPGTFRLVGISSLEAIVAIPGGDVPGNRKIVRRTRPAVRVVPLPNTALETGEQIAFRFRVVAHEHGDVAIKKITAEAFTRPHVGVAPTAGSSVRPDDETTNIAGSTTIKGAGCTVSAGGACIVSMRFEDEVVVPAGTSRTFEVRLNISGTFSPGDFLSVRLLGDSVLADGMLYDGGPELGINGTLYRFIWSDLSAEKHDDVLNGSSDWINGALVEGLPTASVTRKRE